MRREDTEDGESRFVGARQNTRFTYMYMSPCNNRSAGAAEPLQVATAPPWSVASTARLTRLLLSSDLLRVAALGGGWSVLR